MHRDKDEYCVLHIWFCTFPRFCKAILTTHQTYSPCVRALMAFCACCIWLFSNAVDPRGCLLFEHCISEWLALIGASKKSVAYRCASCRLVHCRPIPDNERDSLLPCRCCYCRFCSLLRGLQVVFNPFR